MMAKIVKGSDFKGVVNYILDKEKNAKIIHYSGLFLENKDTIAMSFNTQAKMNGKVLKPVGHLVLSFSKEDISRLTDRVMVGIANEYMENMGIKDTQFLMVRHFDKEHPHLHIAFNRIANDGRTITDRNERIRSTHICKELTVKYRLYMAKGKENVKRDRLKEPDRTKYLLYDLLKTEVGRCGNWNVLLANLKRQGVDFCFKYKGQTNEVQGIVFTMNGYHFNGSKVDRRFSYSKIDATLSRNRIEERVGLRQERYALAQPNVSFDAPKGELYNGSLGLFAPPPNTDEHEQFSCDLRKKKKRRRKGLGI